MVVFSDFVGEVDAGVLLELELLDFFGEVPAYGGDSGLAVV